MDLSATFRHYCNVIEEYPYKDDFNRQHQEDLYGLYKQATIGDAPLYGPTFLQPKALAKWKAWSTVRGMSSADAMSGYILTVRRLLPNV